MLGANSRLPDLRGVCFLKQQANIAAIYCRLSRDDGGDAESNSIQTQRMMLRKYAKDQGFIVRDEYIDDGISGTTFERDGFKRMLADIEEGKVGIVLCKDLSRLGRNNALVAYYTEMIFPDNDVRFIALNDGIDSAKGDNEIMPFKSVINEYYARDISKKVRSAIRTRALNGEHFAGKAPYGYLKSPADKHKLIVDTEAAPIVKTIFTMCADGASMYAICKHLFERRVPTPSALEFQRTGKLGGNFDHEQPWDWSDRSVDWILRNPVYTGSMVSHRQTTKSFKNHSIVRLPEEEWIVVEGTHEALVSKVQFEKVQQLLSVKERTNQRLGQNLFVGLLFCADCGKPLTYSSTKEMRGGEGGFNCSGYRHSYRSKDGHRCTAHNTPYKPLRVKVLQVLNQVLQAVYNEQEFLAHIEQSCADTSEGDRKAITKLRQRDSQLKVLTRRVFEQNASGTITDDTFAELYTGYQAEQQQIAAKINDIEARLAAQQDERQKYAQFLEAVQQYTEIPELTREALIDFIERIAVHEGAGPRGQRSQEIDIKFRFIGGLPQGSVSL
jgi:DNA invertase Pin-like site-specific DNA recombinase